MVNFISYAIRLCAVFLFGSTGETISQKGGHLNLGIPGIMAIGVAGGALGGKIYLSAIGNNPDLINPFLGFIVPFIFALAFGALFGLLFSFFTVNLKSNQNVMGLVLSTFGVGLAILFIKIFGNVRYELLATCFSSLFFAPGAELNWFQQIFLSYGFLVYLSIIISILAALFFKTRLGMNLKAVGENPAAADAAGLNVNRYRYVATVVGCAIASLGGLFYFMDKSGGVDAIKLISEVEDFGWMAIALVIFSMWRTDIGILGAILFSVLYTIPGFFRASYEPLNSLISLLPYVVTVVVLIITSIFFKRASQAPKSLGINYFREDR